MSLEEFNTLENEKSQVLDCEVKDESGLNDFQKIPNKVEIEIPRVGIERFRIPLQYEHRDGSVMVHDSEASMYVFLEKHKTGANMSRFCTILQGESETTKVNNKFFKTILNRYRTELRDYEEENLIPEAELELFFKFPVKQKSLKSNNWGWQYYDCRLKGTLNDRTLLMNLTLNYEYSSTCPCSLSVSKQYEAEFKAGTTTEGSGIASAHSQRSLATVNVFYKVEDDVRIEDVIDLMRKAIPTETQSLVKRVDEQAFAVLNGENPMFVEHASRRISLVLDQEARFIDWNVKIEHFESLHSHNAVAYINKNHSQK